MREEKTHLLAKVLPLFFCVLLFAIPMAHAADFGEEISDEDKDTFDNILQPVMKIYNFVKYAASVIAVLVLLFAGINYMASGSDPRKRDDSKNMATYVLIGLIVIWAAPLVVQFVA